MIYFSGILSLNGTYPKDLICHGPSATLNCQQSDNPWTHLSGPNSKTIRGHSKTWWLPYELQRIYPIHGSAWSSFSLEESRDSSVVLSWKFMREVIGNKSDKNCGKTDKIPSSKPRFDGRIDSAICLLDCVMFMIWWHMMTYDDYP